MSEFLVHLKKAQLRLNVKKYTFLPSTHLVAQVFFSVILACGTLAEEFIQFDDDQLASLQRQLAVEYTSNSVSTDAVLQQYVSELNSRLDANPRTYVTFARDKNINAYAAWGNVIVINSGLIGFAGSESEFAGVLAHEHAHISQRHFSRLPQEAAMVRNVSTAAFLLAMLAGNTDLAHVFAGASGLGVNRELEAMRAFEREADQIAVKTMSRSGFNPNGFVELLDRMKRPSETGLPEYLRTHPYSDDRVADIKSFVRSLNLGAATKDEDEYMFWLARKRSNQLSGHAPGPTPPASVTKVLDDYARLIGNEREAAEAAKNLSRIEGNWIIDIAIAEHYLAVARHGKALELIENTRKSHPDNFALAALHLRALADARDKKGSVKTLAKMSDSLRFNWYVSQAEARLWSELDDEFNYRLAVGYSQYLSGNLDAAKKQVQRLKALSGSGTSLTKIGRLNQLETKINSLTKLVKGS